MPRDLETIFGAQAGIICALHPSDQAELARVLATARSNAPQPANIETRKEIAMIVNSQALTGIKTAYNAIFNEAFEATVSHKDDFAMTVKSSTLEETYGWLGQFPAIREWIGDRVIKSLSTHGFKIINRKFESTVTLKVEDIEDDKAGLLSPLISEMGRTTKLHPDELSFELLAAGFTSSCYDGQRFFDADHPGRDEDGVEISVSNKQDGDGPAWYLMDTSRQIKPVVWQERVPYKFQQVTDENAESVVMRDEYIYGIRARVNCGFGLWQLAFASKAPLTPANYAAARKSMAAVRGDQRQLLGIKPTLLVVPSALEEAALTLINADTIAGSSNIWKGTAKLIVTPYLY